METGTDIHSDFWKRVGVSARRFRIRLSNSFDEFVFCQVCNQCLWSTTTVFTTMVLLQSVPVYLQQFRIYIYIYYYILGATVIYR